MVKNIAWEIEKQRLLESFDRAAGSLEDEDYQFLRQDLLSRLDGVPYLEKVKIAKTGEKDYNGTVEIDMSQTGNAVPIKFRFSLSVPANNLERLLVASGTNGLVEQRGFLQQQIKAELRKENGEIIEGDLAQQLFDYIKEPVFHAIVYLEQQIGDGDSKEGEFMLPRSYCK